MKTRANKGSMEVCSNRWEEVQWGGCSCLSKVCALVGVGKGEACGGE